MKTTPKPVDVLAVALCDGFFEIADEPTRWSSARAEQRETFQHCASAAIATGRQVAAEGVPDQLVRRVAEAIAQAFWERPAGRRAPLYLTWKYASPSVRELFLALAGIAIAAGRELRAARQVARPGIAA